MKLATAFGVLATMVVLICQAAAQSSGASAPTAEDADAFVARAERELLEDMIAANRISWINATYITDDTDALASETAARSTELAVRFAIEAARYQDVPGIAAETRRKLGILRSAVTVPAPTTPGAADELNRIATKLGSDYGKGEGTLNGKPIGGSDLEAEMARSRDPARLREMWTSWHDNVGAPMRQDYARMIGIANAGARELGFADVGALWRSQYDMEPGRFADLADTLWSEVKPLYDDLHCYVRARLNATYGDAVQPATGPIRADLLGNLWAQEWSGIYDIVAPPGNGDLGYDLTGLLTDKGYDETAMVRAGEGFFSSLGFEPLPDTFWSRSMFTKPADRDVVCHASAWDIDAKDDLRLKMCMKVNGSDFGVVHHELGHIYYYRAYKDQLYLYLDGANDGFHEAIGDMIALSVTPEYLVRIGLLDAARVPGTDKDIGLLLRQALDRIAFMPFGLLVDKWRWGVFDGSIAPDAYSQAWDALRLRYQGVVPPVERSERNFDPGGKYHIAANVPYARYLLANVLMFQLYEAACRQAGWNGPLHRCSFYGNRDVGRKLQAMLAMGGSKPWPDALEAFTGSREMSGRALIAYFAPLQAWLRKQNDGRSCGW